VYDFSNGDIRIFLENSVGEDWSGLATWAIPVSQSAIDSGSLTVEVSVECGSDTTLPAANIAVFATVIPQDFSSFDPTTIMATPASIDMVPFAGTVEIVSFNLPLAGVAVNSTLYLGIVMQVEAPGGGARAFIQMWNVRVAQAGA